MNGHLMPNRTPYALAALSLCMAVAGQDITIAYPGEGARLPGITNVYCIGAVPTNESHVLSINGVTTDVYRTGAFLAMVPVHAGSNTITAVWGDATLVRTVKVDPVVPQIVKAALSAGGDAVKPSTHDPYKDLGIPTNAVFAASPPYGKKPWDLYIMVDPGHGGNDTGALSPHGWCEKDVNLLQARAIRDELRRAGFKVVMTRDDDSFPPLYSRPKDAWRLKVDAFISVHHNATAANTNPRRVRHTTTYASNEKGLALAKALQNRIGGELRPLRDCGAQMKSLAVCRNPAVPSCLLEVDFINLPEGEEESWNPERHKRVAKAVVDGLLDWMTE